MSEKGDRRLSKLPSWSKEMEEVKQTRRTVQTFVYDESTCAGFKVIKSKGRKRTAFTESAHTALM